MFRAPLTLNIGHLNFQYYTQEKEQAIWGHLAEGSPDKTYHIHKQVKGTTHQDSRIFNIHHQNQNQYPTLLAGAPQQKTFNF